MSSSSPDRRRSQIAKDEGSFILFSKPHITPASIEEVVQCLQSGWLVTGPRVDRFEAMLQEYLQAPHVIAVSTATDGLLIALHTLNLQAGDEVITPTLTFAATANTIVLAGGTPVLVDVGPDYNITLEAIKEAITPRTRAIMPVHFSGAPVDLDPLYALAHKHGISVIEDAAHAIGTKYYNRRIGSFGDIQVFSFHPNKNITTGEGGCMVVHDTALYERCKRLRFHGIDRGATSTFAKSGGQYNEIIEPGFKANMMDIQAALGLHQLPLLDQFIERRTYLAQRYYEKLQDWSQLTLPKVPSYPHRHAWHLFAVLIHPEETGMTRDEFMARMRAHNIGTGLHYRPLHHHKYYRETFNYKQGQFPQADFIGERIVSLPLFPDLTDEQQDYIIETMAHLLKRI